MARGRTKRKCLSITFRRAVLEKLTEVCCAQCGAKAEHITFTRKGVPVKASINGRCAHFDHIIPICKGGEHTPDNVQILCAKCNLKKGGKYAGR